MTIDLGPTPPGGGEGRPVVPRRVIPLWPERQEHATAIIGMLFFLASWAMMFGGLFYALGQLRLGSEFWPPLGFPALPLALPGFNTAVILASSIALEVGRRSLAQGSPRRGAAMMLATVLLGATFLALQALVWSQLGASGLHHGDGPYGSLVYFLTGFHGAHVVVGLGILAWLLPIRQGRKGRLRHQNRTTIAAMFWHFVSVVWCLIFLFLFLL